MKLPKRFAISTLLLLMLVVASVFGYLQWRRQRIIADVKWLNDRNCRLTVGEGIAIESFNTLPTIIVRDGILPEVQAFADPVIFISRCALSSDVISVRFYKVEDDCYRLDDDGKLYSLADLKERLREIQYRLYAIGLHDVEFCEHRSGTFFSSYNETINVDEVGE